MEYILSSIISQSKYNHKRVNSYTERIELKLRYCKFYTFLITRVHVLQMH